MRFCENTSYHMITWPPSLCVPGNLTQGIEEILQQIDIDYGIDSVKRLNINAIN